MPESPAFVICAFAYLTQLKRRKGMHIIVKPPEKIKQLRANLELLPTNSKKSKVISYYVDEVMQYQRYKEEHHELFTFSSYGPPLAASIVQSSSQHSYIIGPDKDDEIVLKLYEIISRSQPKGDKHLPSPYTALSIIPALAVSHPCTHNPNYMRAFSCPHYTAPCVPKKYLYFLPPCQLFCHCFQ